MRHGIWPQLSMSVSGKSVAVEEASGKRAIVRILNTLLMTAGRGG